jgi:hypothetical protein
MTIVADTGPVNYLILSGHIDLIETLRAILCKLCFAGTASAANEELASRREFQIPCGFGQSKCRMFGCGTKMFECDFERYAS